MARPPHIRITQNDRTEYAKLVKSSKAKISRTKKNYGIDLSNEIEIKDLESFSSRKEFNEWKEKQQSFTNRNNLHYQFLKNEYGVVASKAEINKISRDTKRAQRIAENLQKEASKKPFIVGGKQVGTYGQHMMQMGKPNVGGITVPPDFDFKKMRTRQDLERKKKNMETRSNEEFIDKRMSQLKDNYITMLQEVFNSHADDVVEKIKQIPVDYFAEMFLFFSEFEFDLYYINKELDYDGAWMDHGYLNDLHRMEKILDDFFLGKIDFPLKGF